MELISKEALIGKYIKALVKHNLKIILPKDMKKYGLIYGQYRHVFGSMKEFYKEVAKYHVNETVIDKDFRPTDISYMSVSEMSLVLLNMVRKAKGMELLTRKKSGGKING